jgi:hypothetical protein
MIPTRRSAGSVGLLFLTAAVTFLTADALITGVLHGGRLDRCIRRHQRLTAGVDMDH